jgi:AmmeMemoRadiSam system protein A
MTPLNESDQKILLHIAREALADYLNSAKIPEPPPQTPPLEQHCGSFVSLHRGKHLRGCVGLITSDKPLYLTVADCAVWAGIKDPRFPPVTREELSELNFEISVLSPPEDIAAEAIEVGRHGLIVSQGGMRGLLLPQVPMEWKWDRERFLQESCLKAGLPRDAWRRGARIQAFTAQVFHESEVSRR